MKWWFRRRHSKESGMNTWTSQTADRHYGTHPYTRRFRVIVAGAMMIEPKKSRVEGRMRPFYRCDESHRGGSRDDAEIVKTAPTPRAPPFDESAPLATNFGLGSAAVPGSEAGD